MNSLNRRDLLLRTIALLGGAALGPFAGAYPLSLRLGNQNPKHIRWCLKHYLAWYQKNIFNFAPAMTDGAMDIVMAGLSEIEAWDTRITAQHWFNHVYFGIEVNGESTSGGRVAIALPKGAKKTRDLISDYLAKKNLNGFLGMRGQDLAGVGWNAASGIFKLYFATDPSKCDQKETLNLLEKFDAQYLPERWTCLRFKGRSLDETRVYAIRREPNGSFHRDENTYSLVNGLLQTTDIYSTGEPQPQLSAVKLLPVLGMNKKILVAAQAQQQEFRLAPDNVRYWSKDRAVLYYP